MTKLNFLVDGDEYHPFSNVDEVCVSSGGETVLVDTSTVPPTVQFFYIKDGEQVWECFQVNLEDKCVERIE